MQTDGGFACGERPPLGARCDSCRLGETMQGTCQIDVRWLFAVQAMGYGGSERVTEQRGRDDTARPPGTLHIIWSDCASAYSRISVMPASVSMRSTSTVWPVAIALLAAMPVRMDQAPSLWLEARL